MVNNQRPLLIPLLVLFFSIFCTTNLIVASETIRRSVSATGAQADGGHSLVPYITADGKYIVFQSDASNLVNDDTNGKTDIFIRSMDSDSSITRLSVNASETESNGHSTAPFISAGGDWIVFASTATNLVTGDSNGVADIFIRSRTNPSTIEMVSVDSGGILADGDSSSPLVSADGRYVIFTSFATNLSPKDNFSDGDIYLRDRTLGKTTLVSINASLIKGDNASGAPFISADGQYITFSSFASNLVIGDTNKANDIFIRPTTDPTTIERISVAADGSEGLLNSIYSSMSADGSIIVFESESSLVPTDTNGKRDIYMRSRDDPGSIRMISVAAGGSVAIGGNSSVPFISPDGNFVVFQSGATNLVANDINNFDDVFLRSRQQDDSITRVSISSLEVAGDGISGVPVVANGGNIVVFHSYASNLVSYDTNDQGDVFTYREVKPGDIDSDGDVTLTDAIVCLKLMTATPNLSIAKKADVNSDGLIGIQEAIYILKELAQ